MGIQLNGTSGTDVISAVDGSLTVEGLTISGDFNIADKIIHSGDTNTAIRFPAADTFTVETAGSERLRIDSSGRVGIGTDNPAEDLHIASNSPYILLDDYDNARKWKLKGTAWFAIEDTTAGVDRLRITSSGQILVGTDAHGGTYDGVTPEFVSEKSGGYNAYALVVNANHAGQSAILQFVKSRGTSDGANTIVQDNDRVGSIYGIGADGTNRDSAAAAIDFRVDGTVAANRMPGRIEFRTTSDSAGAVVPTERLRIDSSGRVGINYAASPPSETIHISSATGDSSASVSLSHISGGNRYGARFSSYTATANSGITVSPFFNSTYWPVATFTYVNSTEKLQIGSTNNTVAGTKLIVGSGNNMVSTALINTQDTDIDALTLSNWDGSTTTNRVFAAFDSSGRGGFKVGMPAATDAFVVKDWGGSEYIHIDGTGRLGFKMTPGVWNTANQTVLQLSGTNAGLNLFTRTGGGFLTSNFWYKSDDAGVFQAASGYGLMQLIDAANGQFKFYSSTTTSSSANSSASMIEKFRISPGYTGSTDVKGIPAHLRLYSLRDTSDWDNTDPIGKLDFYVGDDTTNNLPYNAGFIHCLNETDNANEPSGALVFGTTSANLSGGAIERVRIASGGQMRVNPPATNGGSTVLAQQALIGTKHIYTAYHNFSSTNSNMNITSIKTNSCGELWIIGGWANGNGLRMKKYTWVASGDTAITEQSNTFASRYGVGITINTPTMSISGDYVHFNFTFSDNQGSKLEKLKIHFEYFYQFKVDS